LQLDRQQIGCDAQVWLFAATTIAQQRVLLEVKRLRKMMEGPRIRYLIRARGFYPILAIDKFFLTFEECHQDVNDGQESKSIPQTPSCPSDVS
jgi:hypothetical protein